MEDQYLVLVGRIEQGMTLIGPFNDAERAHEAGFEHCDAAGGESIFDTVDLLDPMQWIAGAEAIRDADGPAEEDGFGTFMVGTAKEGASYVCVTGTIFDGMSFIGPFPSATDAEEFGSNWCAGWEVIGIHKEEA